MRVLNDALMMHHFILCMQDYVPLCTIPQLLVHGEPFGSLVQNNAIGFFLMPSLQPLTGTIFLAMIAATANTTVPYNYWHHR